MTRKATESHSRASCRKGRKLLPIIDAELLSVTADRYYSDMATHRKYTDENLAQAVPNCISVAQVLKAIGLKPVGGNYKTVRLRMKTLGLDTSHFLGQAWLRGKPRTVGPIRPIESIMVEGSRYRSSMLKKRLIREGLKSNECEGCGLSSWRGRQIPLELDHINGRNDDNRLINLRILCPNCHAPTATYRARNIRRR